MNVTTDPGLVTDAIDVGTVRSLRLSDPDMRIIDVRSGGEFETVHIPGSYNVPLNTLAEHARDLANVEHSVVLVCQTGRRAVQAHAELSSAGKQALHILKGGMVAWQSAGGDVTRGTNQRWAMDRQVRLVAGSLVLTGIAASVLVPRAKWLSGGVGAGLTYSALSNTCTMAAMLEKLPYNSGDDCDIAAVIAELNKKVP